eukprot:Polyplicarium_translucidae@DN3796_c0_g1_i1.p1
MKEALRLLQRVVNIDLGEDFQESIAEEDSVIPFFPIAQMRSNHLADTRARLLLTKLLRRVGKDFEADRVLLSVEIRELRRTDKCPPEPISTEDRQRLFRIIQKELNAAKRKFYTPEVQASPSLSNEAKQRLDTWVNHFAALVRENALDSRRIEFCQAEQRVLRAELKAHPSRRVAPLEQSEESGLLAVVKNDRPDPEFVRLRYARVKAELGLVYLEEIVGWEGFAEFMELGLSCLRIVGRVREAVRLVSAALNRSPTRTVACRDRRECVDRLHNMSLKLSLMAGIRRMALKNVRALYQRQPDRGSRVLQAYGKLLFVGPNALRAKTHVTDTMRFAENRSWAIRKLRQRPFSFPLTMIVAHFCSMSGQWLYAVAEYTRAHRLMPRDDLTCLCLATAYLNLATSRRIADRHSVILRGFAVLARYLEMRKETCGAVVAAAKAAKVPLAIPAAVRAYYAAEGLFNLGRAYQHFGLTYLAAPTYMKCLSILDDAERAWNSAPAREDDEAGETREAVAALVTFDLPQVRWSAAHGLGLTLARAGVAARARRIVRDAFVWRD